MNAVDALIAAEVRAAGPIPDAHDAIAVLVKQYVRALEDGSFAVEWSKLDGTEATIADVLADLKREKPSLFVGQTTNPVEGNLTERMTAMLAARQTGSAHSKEIAANAAALGNPWLPGRTQSITRQMTISKNDPELAAKLRREASQ